MYSSHNKHPDIIVIGDIMIDHYKYIKPEKFANEAPIPVYNFIEEEYKLGGCGNVLMNLYSLGCENLYIFAVVGDDNNGKKIINEVDSLKIHNFIKTKKDIHTVTKTRYYCENKMLFRCDTENNLYGNYFSGTDDWVDKIENIISTKNIDAIILSDYNKGVLNPDLCKKIIKLANKYNIITCVDPKKNYEKYYGCTIIKPNIHETYDIFNIKDILPVEELHKIVFSNIKCKYSLITMAEKGITIFDGETTKNSVTKAKNIIDVTGAGDIVCCILAYYMSLNLPIQDIIDLATNIATKSVQHMGTYTLGKKDILEVETGKSKLILFEDLLFIKELYKEKKIAFTNGCFDILHDGHINLFKFCKDNGDILVVGLNSDNSIKKLKGETRPINKIKTRLEILKSIVYIDYIIVFEEETPIDIIKNLEPYCLIKGGDYTKENVVGNEFVNKTLIFNTVEGISTTKIIEKIKNTYNK